MAKRIAGPISRLAPPLGPLYEVQRVQVCEQIFSAGGAKLVLICAAAGFGKTTVMRQVRQRCEISGLASAWLNLDAGDNDIARLLAGLAAALDEVMPGISEESSEPHDVGGQTAVALLERISRHREPFVLFLDEFEIIHSTAVLSLMKQLIQALPAGAQLVIGSRVMPDLGLGRLRASGRLLEIEPAQLRFTLDETGDFLRLGRRLVLPPEDVGRLHTRTEGWAAALWLASLSLAERERPLSSGRREPAAEFIARFSGSDAAIGDYLAEDVLSHQSPEVREFLLKTSILNVLTAEACDAIRGSSDSQEFLSLLERVNLFTAPLDSQRSAYRYHGLFSEFLRGQLRREFADEVPRLHRAAAEWYRSQNRPVLAIEHALLSGDLDHALPMLEAHAPRLLADARMRLLARWLGEVPADRLKAHPVLRIVHAWAVNFTSGPREALALIESFDTFEALGGESLAYLLALKLVLLLRMDRIEEAHRAGLSHLERLPERAGFARSMFANALGTASMMLGEYREAQGFLVEARRVQAPVGSSFSVVLSESVEGAMDLLRGHLRQATARLRGALEPRVNGPARYAKANALAGVLLAEALYEADERAESERLLIGYLPLIHEGGLPDQLISGHVLLARLLALRGDHDQAFQVIMELEYVGHRQQLPRVAASARLERARLALRSGKLDTAEEELQFAADPAVWDAAGRQHMVANDVETFEIAQLRLLLWRGRAADAIAPLSGMLAQAEQSRRMRRVLKLRILLADALYRSGQQKQGLRELVKALEFGQGEGFVRSFADEGESVLAQVRELMDAGAGTLSREYLERILAAGGQERQLIRPDIADGLTEPLSRKEIAVLKLVSEGLSNRALAQKMFLSETTIRTHMRNINAKLGVHSRVQAIVAARRLGYLN